MKKLHRVWLLLFFAAAATGMLSACRMQADGLLPKLGCAAGYLLLAFLLKKAAERPKVRCWLEKHFKGMVLLLSVLVFGGTLFLANLCRYVPAWDLDAIYSGAQNWLGGCLTSNRWNVSSDGATYFYWFPNNLGGMAVLAGAMRLFGTADPFRSACILNCALLALFFASTALSAEELFGVGTGAACAGLLLASGPLWFAGACFYTDVLTLAFAPAGIYAFLRAERCGVRRGRLGWGIASALLFSCGGFIKVTVLIVPIALILSLAVRRQVRSALLFAAAAVLFPALFYAGLNAALYPAQLDPAQARRDNTPVWHFFMMGLRGDGGYNPEDYELTRSFSDPVQRNAALRAEIGQRLRQLGLSGLLRHAVRKLGIDMGSGTWQLSDFYDDTPQQPEWMRSLLLPGGAANSAYTDAADGLHLCLLALALVGAAARLRSREETSADALFLAYLGLLCFLLLWETNPRYTVNATGILMLCACCGASAAFEKRAGKSRGAALERKGRRF
jgi:hypothetical protein